LYTEKGKNGTLFAIVRIVDEVDRWREGKNVHTKHYVSLSDAVKGCIFTVPTVHGSQLVKV